MLLSIEHITHYQYGQSVKFGTHRLLVRPLEGHDVQIRASTLVIEPTPRIRWIRDAFDNSIAILDFDATSDHLRIESTVQVEQYNTNPFDFVVAPEALSIPFEYQASEQEDVRPYILRQYPDDASAIAQWVRPFLDTSGRARTLEFLTALNKSVPLYFTYVRREEPGVQSPATTLKTRSGSCRDFALLLMETARQLGLAARYVSGYLCRTDSAPPPTASDSTHAWTEVYLPGAGWKGFDPTCGILAADAHVRVAVTRTPEQATPVSGDFTGPAEARPSLNVTVDAKVVQ